MREIIESAARVGEPSIYLETSRGLLHLVLMDVPGSVPLIEERRTERITLASLPLMDPESTRRKHQAIFRYAELTGKVYRPILRLDLAEDLDVETVVNALECYASNEGAVYLADFRSR